MRPCRLSAPVIATHTKRLCPASGLTLCEKAFGLIPGHDRSHPSG